MTTLVKQSPFMDFEAMERRFRRMLESVGVTPSILPVLMPAADVYEAGGEYVVELEVPGFDEEELAVQVTDHTLTVTGVRKEAKEEVEKSFRLHERLERQFERRFTLPAEIDTERIGASFGKGVLKLHAPMPTAAAEPRKVPISKE
jgi:HSP20 family protein